MPRIALALVLLGCAHEPPTPSWPLVTTLHPASQRCADGRCTCREPGSEDDQADAEPPAPGRKRFELRLSPSDDPAWVEIAGEGVWAQEPHPSADACLYVELPAGKAIRLRYQIRASEPTRGGALALSIAEHGEAGWYDTARVACGGGGVPCDRVAMEGWLAEIHALERGLHDPCGSTKLEEPSWSAPGTDLPHLPIVTAELTLHVYQFAPKLPHGSPDCGQRHKDNF
jgi:hypothetical protein